MARRRSPSSGSSPLGAVPELSLEDYDPMPYEELICAICHSVLRDPVECPCHHVFCRRCIWEWVHKDNSCPICRKRGISAVTPVPPFVRNMLNSLKVKCRNAGCNARVPAESFVHHTSACEFHEVSCPHEACEHRCQRRLLESHVKQCPLREVTCEKGCGLVLTRGRLKSHSCVDELKRKLDEATSECDDWRQKAADATEALNRLRDTLRRLGDTAVVLESSIGDLNEQLRSANRLTAPGPHNHQSTTAAARPSRIVQHPSIHSTSTINLGALFGTQTMQIFGEDDSESDLSEGSPDVEESFSDVP
ncbi:RING finger protein 151 [Rhipicephalus sanguineus]|uniref:RING finger protein 151 n=1 Tax=Rhipicephalus sanguineus TaxID=34632 RepID=UPI001895D4D0|nr:RING finger protein 151 [Rhipicephalus sanguineus]